jgi:hypothetical protein
MVTAVVVSQNMVLVIFHYYYYYYLTLFNPLFIIIITCTICCPTHSDEPLAVTAPDYLWYVCWIYTCMSDSSVGIVTVDFATRVSFPAEGEVIAVFQNAHTDSGTPQRLLTASRNPFPEAEEARV